MSNDYIDYNNEEVSNYPKSVDPREHNVVARINELKDHKNPIIEDDRVSIEMMKNTHEGIVNESDSTDNAIKNDIDNLKKDIQDDGSFIIVGDNT